MTEENLKQIKNNGKAYQLYEELLNEYSEDEIESVTENENSDEVINVVINQDGNKTFKEYLVLTEEERFDYVFDTVSSDSGIAPDADAMWSYVDDNVYRDSIIDSFTDEESIRYTYSTFRDIDSFLDDDVKDIVDYYDLWDVDIWNLEDNENLNDYAVVELAKVLNVISEEEYQAYTSSEEQEIDLSDIEDVEDITDFGDEEDNRKFHSSIEDKSKILVLIEDELMGIITNEIDSELSEKSDYDLLQYYCDYYGEDLYYIINNTDNVVDYDGMLKDWIDSWYDDDFTYFISFYDGECIETDGYYAYLTDEREIQEESLNKSLKEDINDDFIIEDDVLVDYKGNDETVIIPEGITAIEGKVFNGNDSIKNIVFPKSLNCIGQYSFENCNGITSLEIPENVIIIEDLAFNNCNNLETVKILSKNINLYFCSFYNCEKLKEVDIEGKVGRIHKYSFREPLTIFCKQDETYKKLLDFYNNSAIDVVHSSDSKEQDFDLDDIEVED